MAEAMGLSGGVHHTYYDIGIYLEWGVVYKNLMVTKGLISDKHYHALLCILYFLSHHL